MQAWLQFFRIALLPTAWSNALLGAFLNNGLDDFRVSWLALLLGTSTLLYMFGMGLNDFRDRKRDKTLHPDRPLPSGAIGAGTALVVLVLLLAGALTCAAFLGTPALLWASVVVLFILAYNLVCKDNTIFGPVSMGAVRASLVGFGGMSVASGFAYPQAPVLAAAAVVGFYVCLLTYYSMEEERAREASLKFRGRAVFFGVLLALCALQAPQGDPPAAPWWMSFLGICAWCFWTHSFALKPLREKPIRAGLVTYRLLMGLTVLDLAILLTYHLLLPAALSAALWILLLAKSLTKRAS